jgi:hypothetical protein
MSDRSAATRLAVCKWLRDQIHEWECEAKAELVQAGMIPRDREAAMLGRIPIGEVTYCQGRRSFDVVFPDKFAQWVAERWPTEVETMLVVNPAFVEGKLKSKAMKLGALIDDEGEVCPYVEIGRGNPYFMASNTDDAGIAIGAMLERGQITAQGPREITIGGHDA